MGWTVALALLMQGAPTMALAAPMPAGFRVGYSAGDASQSIEERVPAKESVEDWTRMITLQRFGGAGALGAHALLERLGGLMAKSCAGAVVGAVADGTDGAVPVATLRVDCPLNAATAKPETMFARAFAAGPDVYLVQYAYRARPSAEQAATAQRYLASVHLR